MQYNSIDGRLNVPPTFNLGRGNITTSHLQQLMDKDKSKKKGHTAAKLCKTETREV